MADTDWTKPGTGLLAFAYNALYDDETNQHIKGDGGTLDGEMERFNLSPEAREKIRAALNPGHVDANLTQALLQMLHDELWSEQQAIYDRIW